MSKRSSDPDDDILDTDSEEDEFADYGKAGPSRLRGDVASDDDADQSESDQDLLAREFDDEEGDGIAQWAPDDWDQEAEGGEGAFSGSERDEYGHDEHDLVNLTPDLNKLPLSSVAKAHRSLQGPRELNIADAAGKESKVAAARARLAELQRRKGKELDADDRSDDEAHVDRHDRAENDRRAKERIKRENKHAPTTISSRKQVSRLRQVVDVKKTERRDPRFSSLSGTMNVNVHAQSYGFLPTMLRDELAGLKQSLVTAIKAEQNCPLREKERFIQDRQRLELEVARVRTRLEKEERETRERDVLGRVKKEERDKRASGKGAWYMKESEKKDLLLGARFEALEAKGKHAVKKVVEKKRRKEAGKEKKSRPFARGGDGSAPKRRRV
ncbi:rRNA biogenesis protein rrp36 [Cryptotrichosporon argae]